MIRIYGSRIFYYAGKVETYLCYRGHAYQMLPMTDHAREIRAGAGAAQSPVLRLEDGCWLSPIALFSLCDGPSSSSIDTLERERIHSRMSSPLARALH